MEAGLSLHWLCGRCLPASTFLWSYASFTLGGQWQRGAVLVWVQARSPVLTLGWKTPAKTSFIATILRRPTGHRSWSTVHDLSQLRWTSDVHLPFYGERDACLPGPVIHKRPGEPRSAVLCTQAGVPLVGTAGMPRHCVHTDVVWLRATEKELA